MERSEQLEKYIESLIRIKIKSDQEFDRLIVLMSSGSILLTISLLKDDSYQYKIILFVGLLVAVFTLIYSLYAHRFSSNVTERLIDVTRGELNNLHLKEYADLLREDYSQDIKKIKKNNTILFIFLIVSLMFTTLFLGLNTFTNEQKQIENTGCVSQN